MRAGAPVLVALLLLGPFLPVAGSAPSFEGGKDEWIADLNGPDFRATVNLAVPHDYYVTECTLKATGLASAGNVSSYPDNVTISLEDNILWAFNSTGCGPLGMQNSFADGNKSINLSFEPGGGSLNATARLPKDAHVQNATMELTGVPPPGMNMVYFANFTGSTEYGMFGTSVSGAGDVNGDGYDDVTVGAPQDDATGLDAGAAFVHFGGPEMYNVSDLVLKDSAPASNDQYGYSVSGAGDVNNDGFDDVVIGVPYYRSVGTRAGRAYIFFGGKNMDSTPDVTIDGEAAFDNFGISVSSAGDVNSDGFDDVIVGAWTNYSADYRAGRAYIFMGGAGMDNTPDVILNGEETNDNFGNSVSEAGDVNLDGYDDVIVGAAWHDSGFNSDAGRAYVFFGGPSMDSGADVVLETGTAGQGFGYSVSCAGDVNNDSCDDVVVGVQWGEMAFVYLGGVNMNAIVDVFIFSLAGDRLGYSVSGAGDINHDGYDDLIVGAPHKASNTAGKSNIYLGGPNMDNVADAVFFGPSAGDRFGASVSAAGDVNNDSYDDIIIGAPNHNQSTSFVGRAYTILNLEGILDLHITVASEIIWNRTGFFKGDSTSGDFTAPLERALQAAPGSFVDKYGNSFADVNINAQARNNGSIRISNIRITYQYNATIPDFAADFNGYLLNHQDDEDANGNISLPLMICAGGAGRVKLSGLETVRDFPPSLIKRIGTAEMDEDTANEMLIDLYLYFHDDVFPDKDLNFSVVSSTNSSFIGLYISANRYVAVDALAGPANDNWTGAIDAKVACSDNRGQATESNLFTIIVRNVNDPPIITSRPVISAEPSVPYCYNVTAIDGDGDTLHFGLDKAPADMTIDPSTGKIQWLPVIMGNYRVELSAWDEELSDTQSFNIYVPNRPPAITGTPQLNATEGIPYIYRMTAEDPNRDTLIFDIGKCPNGMKIDRATGEISWTPNATGDFDVSAKVSDGRAWGYQNFTLRVVSGNRAPEFITVAVTNATVDIPYEYNASAMDSDMDSLTFSIVSGPNGLWVNATTGKVAWIPETTGNFTTVLKVSDGEGGEAVQKFTINVSEAVKPSIELVTPKPGAILKGMVKFSGTVTKGTRDVARVQVRTDGKEWDTASGTYNWTHKIDSKSLKNGNHTFEFRAFDGKEYSDVVKADFKVDNPSAAKRFIPFVDGFSVLSLAAIVYVLLAMRRQKKAR